MRFKVLGVYEGAIEEIRLFAVAHRLLMRVYPISIRLPTLRHPQRREIRVPC